MKSLEEYAEKVPSLGIGLEGGFFSFAELALVQCQLPELGKRVKLVGLYSVKWIIF